jgi:hypothetical protein
MRVLDRAERRRAANCSVVVPRAENWLLPPEREVVTVAPDLSGKGLFEVAGEQPPPKSPATGGRSGSVSSVEVGRNVEEAPLRVAEHLQRSNRRFQLGAPKLAIQRASSAAASEAAVTRYQIVRILPRDSASLASALTRQLVCWPPLRRPDCLAKVL